MIARRGAFGWAVLAIASAVGFQNRGTRFVNAIPGTTLEVGSGDKESLPATMTGRFLRGIEFGRVPGPESAASGVIMINYLGYLLTGSTAINLVAVQQGTTDAILLARLVGQGTLTLYAIGEPNTPFPVRGLLCSETNTVDVLTDCLVTDLPISN